MPYNVTIEEALKHSEVKTRLASSITKLKQVTFDCILCRF